MSLRDDIFEVSGGENRAAGGSRAGALTGNQYLIFMVRVILAAVFIYAALQKIGKPLMFADEIKMYGLIGRGPVLYTIAIILPWLEIFCGLSLLSGLLMRGSALILIVFNAVFIAVIAYRTAGIMRGTGTPFTEVFFDCGCGFGATYAWKKLIEDILFLAGALLVFMAPGYRFVAFQRARRAAGDR